MSVPHLLSSCASRRLFLASAAAFCTPLLQAQAPAQATANPLTSLQKSSLGDDMQVAMVWLHLAEQASRAAYMAKCDIGKTPLAELEWQASFQTSLAQDCRDFTRQELVNRVFVQPWLDETEKTWQSLSTKEQAYWRKWLAEPASLTALQSLRVHAVLTEWSHPDWDIDARTGTPTTVRLVWFVQALRQIGMLGTVSQAIQQADKKLGQQFDKIQPLARMSASDGAWLQEVCHGLKISGQLDPIIKNYLAIANKQWPQRLVWFDGPMGKLESQCDPRPSPRREISAKEAMRMRPADYAPATMRKFCS